MVEERKMDGVGLADRFFEAGNGEYASPLEPTYRRLRPKHPYDLAVSRLNAFFEEQVKALPTREEPRRKVVEEFSAEVVGRLRFRFPYAMEGTPCGDGNVARGMFREIGGIRFVLALTASYFDQSISEESGAGYWTEADKRSFFSSAFKRCEPAQREAHRVFFEALAEEAGTSKERSGGCSKGLTREECFRLVLLDRFDKAKFSRYLNGSDRAGFHPLMFRDPLEVACDFILLLSGERGEWRCRLDDPSLNDPGNREFLDSSSKESGELRDIALRCASEVSPHPSADRRLDSITKGKTWGDALFASLFFCCIGSRFHDAFGYCHKRLGTEVPQTGYFIGRGVEACDVGEERGADVRGGVVVPGAKLVHGDVLEGAALFLPGSAERDVAIPSSKDAARVFAMGVGHDGRSLALRCANEPVGVTGFVKSSGAWRSSLRLDAQLEFASSDGTRVLSAFPVEVPESCFIVHTPIRREGKPNTSFVPVARDLRSRDILIVGVHEGSQELSMAEQMTMLFEEGGIGGVPENDPLFPCHKGPGRAKACVGEGHHVLRVCSDSASRKENGGQCLVRWSAKHEAWTVCQVGERSHTIIERAEGGVEEVKRNPRLPSALNRGDRLVFVSEKAYPELSDGSLGERRLRSILREYESDYGYCFVRWGVL